MEGFARSDTASRTITASIGGKSVTSATLSTTAGTFTKFVLNFEATASEVNQDLKLWLSGAGSVFVDKLSLTQAYDMYWCGKTKITRTGGNGILGTYSASGNQIGILTTTTNLRNEIGITSTDTKTLDTTYPVADSAWHSFKLIADRTGNIQSTVDANALQTSSMTSLGKHIMSQALQIGKVWVAHIKGQISHNQIIRFENISQSTFNSAIKGLQYPTGGGAEEVLRLTFQNGSSITECLKDYSPKGHTVSGILVDITNRKKVTA